MEARSQARKKELTCEVGDGACTITPRSIEENCEGCLYHKAAFLGLTVPLPMHIDTPTPKGKPTSKTSKGKLFVHFSVFVFFDSFLQQVYSMIIWRLH